MGHVQLLHGVALQYSASVLGMFSGRQEQALVQFGGSPSIPASMLRENRAPASTGRTAETLSQGPSGLGPKRPSLTGSYSHLESLCGELCRERRFADWMLSHLGVLLLGIVYAYAGCHEFS
eukprot:s128_g45.t1